MSSKKIKYKYGSDCRNLSPWRMKGTLSMKWKLRRQRLRRMKFISFLFYLFNDLEREEDEYPYYCYDKI